MSKVGAIVVSAGLGQRMGADKTFLNLYGKSLISWSLAALHESDLINKIVLVLHKSNIDAGRKLITQNGWSKIAAICEGGDLRQTSVRNGISALTICDYVLIHDGARPFITSKLIEDGIRESEQCGATAAAVEVKDTIKRVDEAGFVLQTINRSRLRVIQTPQVFRVDIIKKAYEMVSGEFTDDAALVERAGYRVKLYAGDYENIKITTPEDLIIAEEIAKRRFSR